ncbi:MAG: agmatine deiminase family protein [Kiritimatiellales bacterium]|nr:agmatine deiminase family protein [Kiritimatiellales bacterium]MCF7864791.1 agmatine deiminase family protein [Kiritimatiellales bacterium]
MHLPTKRLPAEWEPQDAVLLVWPHANTDWAYCLDEAQHVLGEIETAIRRFERVVMVRADACAIPSNDIWARDFGPITIKEDGQPVLLDFTFNGWGGKFEAKLDNAITGLLHRRGEFGETPLRTVPLILEGGSIESDGAGTILTTEECLLNPNRNPQFSKEQIEKKLKAEFGANTILWLKHGHMAGDDTDAHIDTLARLCPDRTIVYVACDDPADEHYDDLKAMERELQAFDGYRLLPLPWPGAKYDTDGERLPATYANYLVINGAVLVPTYNDPKDFQALEVIEKAFPDREIIGIDCSTLIRQHGSLHCVTMQIPNGVL